MSAYKAQADSYLATKVLTASPAELRLMLLDGAVKFTSQGRDALAAKNYEGMFTGFTRTRDILVELSTTMRSDIGDPGLVERMQSLYAFMMARLLEASHNKDVAAADEVVKLLEFERDTWILLMERLAAEQRPAGGLKLAAGTAAAPAAAPQGYVEAPGTHSYTPFTAHG